MIVSYLKKTFFLTVFSKKSLFDMFFPFITEILFFVILCFTILEICSVVITVLLEVKLFCGVSVNITVCTVLGVQCLRKRYTLVDNFTTFFAYTL